MASATASATSAGSGSSCRLGAAEDRVDRRAAERLEHQPFAHSLGQDLGRSHWPGRDALDPQRPGQRSADGERNSADAAEPGGIAREEHGPQAAGLHCDRCLVGTTRCYVAFPEHAHFGAVRHALNRPDDRWVLAAAEVGKHRYDHGVCRVTCAHDQCIAFERRGTRGHRQLGCFPVSRYPARKPGARHGHGEVCGNATMNDAMKVAPGYRRVAQRGLRQRSICASRDGCGCLAHGGPGRTESPLNGSCRLLRICQSVSARIRKSNHSDQWSM